MISITAGSITVVDPQQAKEDLAQFKEDIAQIRRQKSSSRKGKNGTVGSSLNGGAIMDSFDTVALTDESPDGMRTAMTFNSSIKSRSDQFDRSGNHQEPKRSMDGPTIPGAGTGSAIMTINVAGLVFQTLFETVEKYPETLLGNPLKRQPFFNPATGEYFFDRHRNSFESILHFYQNGGRLKRPAHVPIDIFLREVKFFELGDEALEGFWHREGFRKPETLPLPENRFQLTLWQLVEIPDSSPAARIVAFISVGVIVLSTLSFCLETLPELQERYRPGKFNVSRFPSNRSLHSNKSDDQPISEEFQELNPFFVIELVCISWFTLEFCLRLLSCPSKLAFLRSFLNWVDFVAIVPFFINLAFSTAAAPEPTKTGGAASGGENKPQSSATMSFAVLRVLRLVRVFRIFKLSRHSRGLQILGLTFRASIQELCLLVFFLMIGLVLFSSAVYFAENGIEGTKFTSIPEAFWYAIVTMTTVGYGDLTPVGPLGKLVGSFCAIIGVLVLALPVPVIVANFKHFYRQESHLAHMRAMDDAEKEVECDDSDTSS